MNIGEKIKTQRLKNHWSQKQLAEIIGVNKSTICQYETYLRTPSPDKIIKLCSTFQVSADYLLGIKLGANVPLSTAGLTESQITIVNNIIREFRNGNNG